MDATLIDKCCHELSKSFDVSPYAYSQFRILWRKYWSAMSWYALVQWSQMLCTSFFFIKKLNSLALEYIQTPLMIKLALVFGSWLWLDERTLYRQICNSVSFGSLLRSPFDQGTENWTQTTSSRDKHHTFYQSLTYDIATVRQVLHTSLIRT